MDDGLTSRLHDIFYKYDALDESKQVFTGDRHSLLGPEAGLRPGNLTDNNGIQHRIGLRRFISPKLGRNLFSPSHASPSGISTII